jgi:hypothetical protein
MFAAASIPSSPKMETTHISIGFGMNKQNRVFPYNGIIFIHEKK